MHSYRFSRRSALGGGQACDLAATLAILPPRSPPRSSFGTRIMAETKPKAPRCVRRMQGCPRERRSQICLACTASGRAASRTLPRLRAARADEPRCWPQPPPMVNEAASVPAFREPSRGSNPRGGSRREPAVAIVAFVASEPSHGLADGQLRAGPGLCPPPGRPCRRSALPCAEGFGACGLCSDALRVPASPDCTSGACTWGSSAAR
jgi:hypothetical protein